MLKIIFLNKANFYLSIKDLPIDNWIRLIDENDYSYLHKKNKKTILNNLVFELIQDQIIDEFGVGDDFKKILRNQINMELMAIKQIKTGDYSTQAKIELIGLENDQILNRQGKVDLYDILIAIENKNHVKLNIKEVSVYEFYKYASKL